MIHYPDSTVLVFGASASAAYVSEFMSNILSCKEASANAQIAIEDALQQGRLGHIPHSEIEVSAPLRNSVVRVSRGFDTLRLLLHKIPDPVIFFCPDLPSAESLPREASVSFRAGLVTNTRSLHEAALFLRDVAAVPRFVLPKNKIQSDPVECALHVFDCLGGDPPDHIEATVRGWRK